MATWQVNQAKNHWNDVLDQAENDGPQIITHDGKERAVVLSIEAYRTLKPEPQPQQEDKNSNFIEFLLSGPRIDFEDWEIARDKDVVRDFDFD